MWLPDVPSPGPWPLAQAVQPVEAFSPLTASPPMATGWSSGIKPVSETGNKPREGLAGSTAPSLKVTVLYTFWDSVFRAHIIQDGDGMELAIFVSSEDTEGQSIQDPVDRSPGSWLRGSDRCMQWRDCFRNSKKFLRAPEILSPFLAHRDRPLGVWGDC